LGYSQRAIDRIFDKYIFNFIWYLIQPFFWKTPSLFLY
jgi:hypothetical protein